MITVKFFGEYKETTGTDELLLKPQGYSTVKDILDIVPGMFKGLDISEAKVAKNAKFVDPGEQVADGDEIAIFPPVSGG
jgi:molybdopterin converting factor small subunit